ncbi:hypothetical protein ISS86_02190 [Candidatus Microgenomates bacterium]|nr:hypothetical protein [Candidatus Microgenomates bacterium]
MKKLFVNMGTFLTGLYLAAPALAQTGNNEPWKVTVDEPKYAIPEFGSVIKGGIQIAILIAGLLCLVYLIWGGIEWLTSGGAKEGVAAAKARMTAAFIGMMIILAAWAIIQIVGYLFNINITQFEFEPFY